MFCVDLRFIQIYQTELGIKVLVTLTNKYSKSLLGISLKILAYKFRGKNDSPEHCR